MSPRPTINIILGQKVKGHRVTEYWSLTQKKSTHCIYSKCCDQSQGTRVQKHIHKQTKPKPTGPSSPVITAHTSVHNEWVQIVVHNTAQNSSDNLPSYPPDTHHSSQTVYWRRGRRTVIVLPGKLLSNPDTSSNESLATQSQFKIVRQQLHTWTQIELQLTVFIHIKHTQTLFRDLHWLRLQLHILNTRLLCLSISVFNRLRQYASSPGNSIRWCSTNLSALLRGRKHSRSLSSGSGVFISNRQASKHIFTNMTVIK